MCPYVVNSHIRYEENLYKDDDEISGVSIIEMWRTSTMFKRKMWCMA